MSLVIEDGSIVEDANSYVTRAEFIAYAATFGVTIADAVEADQQLIVAAEFIASHEPQLKGSKVSRLQAMAFPREGVVLEGFEWYSDEIPRLVLLCQMALALEVNDGIDLYNPPPNPTRAKKSEKVDGAVEVEYFGNDAAVKLSRASRADALLKSLLKNAGLTSLPLVRA
jgi:hypothetical protein